MKALIYWYYSLSMEEIFILTGIGVLLIGTGLGLLGEWLFGRGNNDG